MRSLAAVRVPLYERRASACFRLAAWMRWLLSLLSGSFWAATREAVALASLEARAADALLIRFRWLAIFVNRSSPPSTSSR